MHRCVHSSFVKGFHLQRFTFQVLMSASATIEVVTTTAITQLEVILAPVIMATILTMMDILVKVGKYYINLRDKCEGSSCHCIHKSGCLW